MSFLDAKLQFDKNYSLKKELIAFIPVNQTKNKNCSIKDINNKPNEEYYKWQFFYALVYSGLYQIDYIGSEIYFPKGNKNSAPIILDGAIFDDSQWFNYYQQYHNVNEQSALDWLRKHLLAVIEFKRDSKNIETIYNSQLKPAMKESENNFCLGILYNKERLHIFQKKNNNYLRYDESYNLKGNKSTIKDISLHLTDAYYKLPSFEQLKKRAAYVEIDRSMRMCEDLDIITGVYSKQLTEGISNILKIMDKVGMKNQRGYEILIQTLALKIFDEKRSTKGVKKYLEFYMDKAEKNYTLADKNIQEFITRMRRLYKEAASQYQKILKRQDTETITWEKESHVHIIKEVVEQLQDYSFIKSYKTDLYQLVFYKFANEFSKADKGQFITPIPIIDFLVKIVNPRKGEKIIDPTVGIADFLSVSYVNSESGLDDNDVFGIDNDEQMVMLSQLNMLLNGDGNAKLEYMPNWGSIMWKFNDIGNLVELNPELHIGGNWDNWKDQTRLKKFDVVLTNPPFGEQRKIEPKTQQEKDIMNMYELWRIARAGSWIDPGLVFLENAYRILDEDGRMGIVLSNSIASIDRWERARKWLIEKMRIVALFDLPSNVFADAGVNTTIIVAYKPDEIKLKELKESDYNIFIKNIKKVGYEIRTLKRVKFFNPIYKINMKTFDIEQDIKGSPIVDEEFQETIKEFKKWCLGQEKTLQDIFLGG
jgi:type I restriction enzyme M protein